MSHPILDQPEVLRALFYPRREYDPASYRSGVHRIAIQVEQGVILGARLYPAGLESPTILYFHGNGEIAADYDGLAPLYTRLGITLLVADYRGYGTSGGTPTASHLLSDAVILFEQVGHILEDHGLISSQIYAMGRSLGSAAAIEVAQHGEDRLAGLIIESGFADTFVLLRRLGWRVQDTREEHGGFGNAAKLSRVRTRTLIIHGRDDELIPATEGHDLYQSCGAADKRLVLIPGAGHNDLMIAGMSAYFDAIRAFVGAEA